MSLELLEQDIYDRQLLELVRPPSWQNPKPEGRYNLVAIGAGAAGLVSAVGAAGLGAKVALIERGLLGGDCLNAGCVPSKALIRAARAAHAVRQSEDFGVRVAPAAIEVDFGAVMERVRRKRAAIAPHDSAKRLQGLGVDVFLGEARFVAPDMVEVGGQRLSFARAVIATGARATGLPIPGLEEAGYLTNENVFALTELPRRLLVIGAGPIGCELAQAFRRFGAEVTVVELMNRVLFREDKDASAVVAKALARDGVELVLGAKTLRAEVGPGGQRILVVDRGKGEERLEGDAILVSVGRRPNTDGLDLELADVAYDKTGVLVDDRLQTSNPRIYAAGDICSRFKFTHAADAMARIVIQNALFMGRKRASALVIPWCTYTDPELAHVGLSEEEAKAQRKGVQTFTVELGTNDRAVLDGDTEGFARVHADRKGRILGATIVAPHAGELIGELSLAMTSGLGLGALASAIHPYPTQAEALKRLGDMYQRTRLTPFVARLLRRWLAWRRS